MAECLWCSTELPAYEWGSRGHNPRLYCSQVCRQLAHIARRFPDKADRDRFNREHTREVRRRRA